MTGVISFPQDLAINNYLLITLTYLLLDFLILVTNLSFTTSFLPPFLRIHFFLPLGDKVYTLPFLVIKIRLPLFFMKPAALIPENFLLFPFPFQVSLPLVSLYLLVTLLPTERQV